MLAVIEHGQAGRAPPLLIVHGLFGSARNWGVIARRLSDQRHVIAVDLRNHGESPWQDVHRYEDMAGDLAEVIAAYGGQADVLGHSMGGKAAMVLALRAPEMVRSLVVADIAPVAYTHSQLHNIEAMRRVDLSQIARRGDADALLARDISAPTLRSFFTQSLDVANRRWRLNLDVLAAEMPYILGFPEIEETYGGAALFLTGALSDYVEARHRPRIRELFPAARFVKLNDAGHWLHAEKPREFEAVVRAFLERIDARVQ